MNRRDTHRPVIRAEKSSQCPQLTQDADTIYARLSMDGEQCDIPSWGTDSHGVSHQYDVQLGLSTC